MLTLEKLIAARDEIQKIYGEPERPVQFIHMSEAEWHAHRVLAREWNMSPEMVYWRKNWTQVHWHRYQSVVHSIREDMEREAK